MKFSYDPEVDAFNLRISDAHVEDTDEVAPGIIVDYDEKGEVISIEMLDVSKCLEHVEVEIPRLSISSFPIAPSQIKDIGNTQGAYSSG